MAGCCERGNEQLGSVKCGEFLVLAKQLSASREGLCSVELVIQKLYILVCFLRLPFLLLPFPVPPPLLLPSIIFSFLPPLPPPPLLPPIFVFHFLFLLLLLLPPPIIFALLPLPVPPLLLSVIFPLFVLFLLLFFLLLFSSSSSCSFSSSYSSSSYYFSSSSSSCSSSSSSFSSSSSIITVRRGPSPLHCSRSCYSRLQFLTPIFFRSSSADSNHLSLGSAFYFKNSKLSARIQSLHSKEVSQPPQSSYFYHVDCVWCIAERVKFITASCLVCCHSSYDMQLPVIRIFIVYSSHTGAVKCPNILRYNLNAKLTSCLCHAKTGTFGRPLSAILRQMRAT